MKVAFGFSSVFFEDNDVKNLSLKTQEAVPIIIVEWNHPGLPAAGEFMDIELLSSFPQVPPAFILPLEYQVDYVYWGIYENQPIPIIQLAGK